MRIAFIGDSLTHGTPGSSFLAILRDRLPEHQLINLGRGNDTIVSLYRRTSHMRFGGAPFDMAFLWVGVNDLDREGSWSFRIANVLRRQPRSRDLDDFRAHYRMTLELLCRNANRIVAVSPLLKGENIHNRWNRELEIYAGAIASLASHYEQVEYLDLRGCFYARLASEHVTDYLLESPFGVGLDILILRNDAQVDRKAAQLARNVTAPRGDSFREKPRTRKLRPIVQNHHVEPNRQCLMRQGLADMSPTYYQQQRPGNHRLNQKFCRHRRLGAILH